MSAAASPPGSGPESGVAQALADITAAVLSLPALDELLARVAKTGSAATGAGSLGVVTLRQQGGTFTVAAGDPRAERLDEVRYAGAVGPCLQSLETRRVVTVPDLVEETRWGDYPGHALGLGIRSVLSVPLTVDETTDGALGLYHPLPAAFSPAAARDAALIAAGAGGAIGMALRLTAQARLIEQLRAALAARAVIDRAIGIVIRDRRCTPTEAFAVLRTVSQHRNLKLRTVASELVAAASVAR